MSNLTHMLSGSDIRGKALETGEGKAVDLTEAAVIQIGKAIPKWFKKKFDRNLETVAIGHDPRLTGETLVTALGSGLSKEVPEILDVGLATSPAMFMITQQEDLPIDLGIMITASHMPKEFNGIKIVTPEGGLSPQDITEILTIAEKEDDEVSGELSMTDHPYLDSYADHLASIIREKSGKEKPLSGLKIVVDAGNGSGGFFVKKVLEPLGADISGSQYLEPDGNFPNHIPNPEATEAIEAIEKAVLDSNADMGIIFDTDVDRSAIVDETGKPINKSAFIAFIAKLLLKDHPGSTIVTDSITSTGLTDFIEAHGGKHHRFKRGYKNVIDESKRLNEEGIPSVLAMETSGHGAVEDNFFLDDGSYLAVLSLLALIDSKDQGHPISEYLKDYHYPLEEEEIRLTITDEDFRQTGQKLIDDFREFGRSLDGYSVVEPNYEGVRLSCDVDHGNGWILMRQSLHEPKIPINIESDTEGGVEQIKEQLYSFLDGREGLQF